MSQYQSEVSLLLGYSYYFLCSKIMGKKIFPCWWNWKSNFWARYKKNINFNFTRLNPYSSQIPYILCNFSIFITMNKLIDIQSIIQIVKENLRQINIISILYILAWGFFFFLALPKIKVMRHFLLYQIKEIGPLLCGGLNLFFLLSFPNLFSLQATTLPTMILLCLVFS